MLIQSAATSSARRPGFAGAPQDGQPRVTPTPHAAAAMNGLDAAVPTGAAFASDAPPLPEVDGDRNAVSQAHLRQLLAGALLAPPFAWFHAMEVLFALGGNNLEDFGLLKRLHYKSRHQAQSAAAVAQIHQVLGERRSAWVKVLGSIVGVVLAGGVSCYGQSGMGALNAAAQGVGPLVGRTVTDLTDCLDKSLPVGGSYQAQQANLQRVLWENLSKTDERTEQNINDSIEQSRRAMTALLDMNRQVDDKQNQLSTQIYNNI